MGAFNGLGPYNGHWNAREIPRASEPQSTKPKGFYISYNHFFPVSGRVDETKGRWSITGEWFDKKREAEAFFKIMLSEGRDPVRWYKTENDVSIAQPDYNRAEFERRMGGANFKRNAEGNYVNEFVQCKWWGWCAHADKVRELEASHDN